MDSPRELYLAACTEIAESLSPFGFKFARSGPHAQRKEGDFAYRVSFQSSHKNIADHYVALWIHANVLSKRLADWRASQSHALRSDDFVAGGQIGNLVRPPHWQNWNLEFSSSVVTEAKAAVHSIALPYFDRFSDVPKLCALLQCEELPAMHIGDAIEFLLCFADRPAAEAAVASFLRSRPDLFADYRAHLAEFQERGLPALRGFSFAFELAFVTVAHSLSAPKAA